MTCMRNAHSFSAQTIQLAPVKPVMYSQLMRRNTTTCSPLSLTGWELTLNSIFEYDWRLARSVIQYVINNPEIQRSLEEPSCNCSCI